VRDTGFGVASEDFEHVFAEFRQVGNGQAKHEGTGLGLSPIGRLDERPYLGQQPVEVGTAPLLAADLFSKMRSQSAFFSSASG
jgi:hypothetical protein